MIATLCLSLAPVLGVDPLLQEPAASSAPASTSAFSYTYVQLDLVRGDGDGFSDGPDGLDLQGSYALQENLFVFGGFGRMSGDVGNSSLDVNTFGIGLGFHTPLNPDTDLVVGGSLLHANSESGAPGSSADGGGWSLQGGVRHIASAQFELDGTIGLTDYEDSSSNTWLELGAIYRATPQLGICATISTSDDIDSLSLGVRYQP